MGVALAVEQVTPHPLQSVNVRRLVSHPLAYPPRQSSWVELHESIRHIRETHAGVPFLTEHRSPQASQLATVLSWVSQPLVPPSQSARSAPLQTHWKAPEPGLVSVQSWSAGFPALSKHTLSQTPQLSTPS